METLQSTKTWVIDTAHSKIQFKVKHLVVSTVTGSFDEFDGRVEAAGDDFENAQVSFTAQTRSINTHNRDRDNHLKSDDFFNAEKFPELKFKSTTFEKIKGSTYKLKGDLTIRDKTKSIELLVDYSGLVTDPYKNLKAAFEITGQINRKDFGLQWGAVTETGSLVVADEVKLILEVTTILQ